MKRNTGRISALFGLIILSMFFTQCRKEKFATNSSENISFSADTLLFDTVFTTIGSVTLPLKVYNPHNGIITIDDIQLMRGDESPFRIAVDGINGDSFEGVEVPPEDSLWVFVEVTIDPNLSNLPLIEEDSIRFVTNGNTEYVTLAAWGQDAYFHGGLNQINVLDCDEVWNADKPHVIYGVVAVDEGCSLTINSGTQVHCHARSGIYVYRGLLDVNGELGNEVVFQGDRLESEYQDLTGQWGIQLDFDFETGFGVETATINRGGIWLVECEGSEIDYAIMKNGLIGLMVDTTMTTTGESVTVRNTVITNMSIYGIWSQSGHITGENLLVSNCGNACAALTIGGKYDFNHCTFANYWTNGNRQSPAFYLSNYYVDFMDNVQVRPLYSADFKNCFMYGNNADLTDFSECIIDMDLSGDIPEYSFNDCYVDTESDLTDTEHFLNMSQGQGDPPFIDPFIGDFDFSGPVPFAFRTGGANGIPNDIEGVPRSSNPAKGCYMDD